MNFDSKASFIINFTRLVKLGKFIFFAKTGFCTFCHFWTGLSLVILINLGFRQKPKFLQISVGFVKFAKWYQKVVKNQSGKIPKSLKNQKLQKITELAKLSVLSVKRWILVISNPALVILIETLLYCIFIYMSVVY